MLSGMRAQDARRLHRRPGFHRKLDVDGGEVALVGTSLAVTVQFFPTAVLWCLDARY